MSATLSLLGPPQATLAGNAVHLPAKALALLGYLAAHPDPQRREHVIDLLWPDSSAEAARKNGRNLLWAIRRALGEATISANDDLLRLDPQLDLDLWRWEAAQRSGDLEAVALYRGPFLDGLSFDEAPDFELWLTLERERIAQQQTRFISSSIATLRAQGDWPAIHTLADHALKLDPLQEPMYRALMEADAYQGQRNEALRHYELLVTILEHELGVEPLPETLALRQQILDGSLAPIAAAAPVVAARTRPPEQAPLIGRQAALIALDEALEAATQAPSIALISGEIGIGKTRLWREWSATQQQATIFELQCQVSTQALPFAPIIDLLSREPVMRHLFRTPAPLPEHWLAEIARLLPAGRVLLPSLPQPHALPAAEERRRIYEALVQAIKAYPAPVLLGIDDIHWADDATLHWLDYALQRLNDQPLLMVATYRSEEARPTLQSLIATWGRSGRLRRIGLERLGADDALNLLHTLGVAPEQAPQMAAQSAGNPLFLIEWSHNPDASVPPVLAELIAARIKRLPAEAQQIAQAAAILAPDFSFPILRRASGRSEEETLDGLDALLAASILIEDGAEYSFSHPLMATIVLDGMSQARRQFLHLRAAQAREVANAGRIEPLAGRLAIHYQQAGDTKRAAHFADLAAVHALTLAAPAETLAFRRLALELAPTPLRQRELGQALLWLGELSAARSAFADALSSFEGGGQWHQAATTCLLFAETWLPAGEPEQALMWVQRAAAALAKTNSDPVLEAHILLMQATAQRVSGQSLQEAAERVRRARTLAEQHNMCGLVARCDFELGNQCFQLGDFQGAEAALERAATLAHKAEDPFLEVLALNNRAYAAIVRGDLKTAQEQLEAAWRLAEQWSLRVPQQYLWSTQGELALAEHCWNDAESAFAAGIAIAQAHANSAQVANYRANLALAARGRGDLEKALETLRRARDEAAPLAASFLQSQIDLWLSETWLLAGDTAQAAAALHRAEERINDHGQSLLGQTANALRQALAMDQSLTQS